MASMIWPVASSFVDVPHRPGTQGTFGVEVLVVHRPDDGAELVVARPEALDQVDPVAGLQGDVDDRHVRIGGSGELQGLGGIGRLPAYFQVRLRGNPERQRLAHGRVIINDQDPCRRLTCLDLAPGHGQRPC
jgi:hypothetical protein